MTQATVAHWGPEGGEAAYDDGTRVALPPGCLDGGPWRFLRSGQRVRLVLEDDRVVRVELP